MKKDLLIEAGNIHRNIRQDLLKYFDTSMKTDYTFSILLNSLNLENRVIY